MKRTLLLAILLAGLLAVFFIPTVTVHAAVAPVDQQPAPAAQPTAQPVAQQSPAVQIVIGLVVALFGCLALAPAAFGERHA